MTERDMDAARVREIYKMGYEDGMVHTMRSLEQGYLNHQQIIDYIREKTNLG